MIVKNLSFMNYKKFKEITELSLEDFSGRIGILGNNGSGKSTLLDVIPIALYGVEAVTGKKEYLRTHGVEKDMVKLRFEFEHDGREFIIEREFRGANLTPKANLFEIVDGVAVILATSAKDVTAYVERILNMNYATFVSTIFCKQKELDKLSNMEPAERRRFVLKLAGVDKIEDEIKKCRELKREADKYVSILLDDVNSKDTILSDIETLNKDVEKMKNEHKDAFKNLEEAELRFKAAEEKKVLLDEKYEAFNELCIKGKEIQSKINYLDKEIQTLTSDKEELNKLAEYMESTGNSIIEKHKELEKELDELDKERVQYIQKQELIKQLNSIKNEGSLYRQESERLLEEASKLNDTNNSIEDTKKRLTDSLSSAETQLDLLKSEKAKKEAEAKTIVDKGNEFKQEIAKIKNLHNGSDNGDCVCPMCKQAVTKEYVEIVEKHYLGEIEKSRNLYTAVDSDIKNINNSIQQHVETINKLKAEQIELQRQEQKYLELTTKSKAAQEQYNKKISEYKAAMTEYKKYEHITFNETVYSSVKNEKMESDKLVKEVYIAADKIAQLPKIESKLNNAVTSKVSATNEFEQLSAKVKQLNFNREEYVQVKEDYNKANTEFRRVNNETNNLKNQLNMKDVTERKFLQDKLETVKKKEKEYDKYRELSQDYTVIEETLLCTKNNIMKKINPLINKHLSELFKTLISEKYDDIELDEQYNIFIYEAGVQYPLSKYSGGEKDLANLALRLAISKFLAETSSGAIEFVVLDEIFASLDDDRKASLIEVLGNLKNFFYQIFVIAHEDVIKSSLDCYITVKENEFKYAELEY